MLSSCLHRITKFLANNFYCGIMTRVTYIHKHLLVIVFPIRLYMCVLYKNIGWCPTCVGVPFEECMKTQSASRNEPGAEWCISLSCNMDVIEDRTEEKICKNTFKLKYIGVSIDFIPVSFSLDLAQCVILYRKKERKIISYV